MAQLGSTTVFGELSVTAKSLLQGNVGIGTTSPSWKLHVSHSSGGDATYSGGILIENTSTTAGEPNIGFKNAGMGSNLWFVGPNQDTDMNFAYGTTHSDANTKMTITSGGNVGIGTTAPAYALDVSGDVRATGTFRGSLTGNASTATTLATARTINGTSFNGSANITTANWGTARTLTIGSTGKSVNGSGNVSWTLAEIGAAPATHTHSNISITAGNGLSGGGTLAANRTITLATPGTLTASTTNAVQANSHTHSVTGFLPLTGGTLTGGVAGTVFTLDRYIPSPQGGRYTTTTSKMTGAIKITLPVSWNNTMLRFAVDVYNYSTNTSFTVYVGGYNYSSSSAWTNTFAYILARDSNADYTVRFGHDGSKCCVYIGETNKSWSYPQIVVRDVHLGYSGRTSSLWDTGWSIGFATSFGTITSTISDCMVYSRYAKTAGSVAWANVSGKPSTFAPSSHTHAWSEVTGKPSTFTPSSHSHGAGDLPSASTSAKGVVQLSTSTSSTSTTLAATASAVKAAYDVGNHSHPYAPSTHTHSNITITAGNGLSGGGTLAANRTITLGTPGALTNSTTDEVTASSHTHSLPNRTAGSSSAGYVTYSGTTNTAGTFYGGTTAPTGTTRLNYSGYLYTTRSYNAVYNDYAEYFLKDEQEIEAGDIIIKNPNGDGFIKSQKAKSNLVVGVMSTDYAQCIGGDRDVSVEEQEEKYAPVGLAGRVPVKVIGKVEIGDLIVSSDIPGVGMASKEYIPGTVVGKALNSYDSDEVGKIEMLIMNI